MLEYILHGRVFSDVLATCGVPPYERTSIDVGGGIDAARQGGTAYFSAGANTLLSGGTSGGETNNSEIVPLNRVVNFMGRDYFLVDTAIFRLRNDLSNTWESVVTLTNKPSGNSQSTGLYPVFIDGAPHLVALYNSSDGWRAIKLNGLTNTWTNAIVNNGLATSKTVMNEMLFKTKIVFVTQDESVMYSYDYVNDSMKSISFNNEALHPMDMCAFNSELYVLAKDSNLDINIHRVDELSGTTSLVANFDRHPSNIGGIDTYSALSATSNYYGRNCLYVDDEFSSEDAVLYAINPTHGDLFKLPGVTEFGLGQFCYRPGGPSGLERFSTGQLFENSPFRMMINSDGSFGEGGVVRCYIDQRTKFNPDDKYIQLPGEPQKETITIITKWGFDECDPGQTLGRGGGDGPTYMMWNTIGSGEFPVVYKYNGVAFSEDAWHRAHLHEKIGGGSRQSTVDFNGYKLIDMVFRGIEPVGIDSPGKSRIYYSFTTSSGTPNGTEVNVKWFYSDNLHAPKKPCTMTDPSHGSISGGYIRGVIADSGSLYNFIWDVATDGITRNTSINLMGIVATSGDTGSEFIINSPSDIAALSLWLDADDTSTIASGGGGVSSWTNKASGEAISGLVQGTAGSQPTYLSNANNGRGAVVFDGSDDYLFDTNAPESEGPFTTFVVFETNSLSAQTLFSISKDNAIDIDGSGTFDHHSTDRMDVDISNNDLIFESSDFTSSSGTDTPRSITHVGGATTSAAELGIWVETFAWQRSAAGTGYLQEQINPIIDPSGFDLGNTTIGRFSGAQGSGIYSDAGDYFSGRLYELIVYDRQLTQGEVNSVRNYLYDRWSIS